MGAWSPQDTSTFLVYLNDRWKPRFTFTADDVAAMVGPMQKANLSRKDALDAVDRMVDEGFAHLPTAVEIVNAARRNWGDRTAARREGKPVHHVAAPDHRDPPGTVRYVVEQPDGSRIPAGGRTADDLARERGLPVPADGHRTGPVKPGDTPAWFKVMVASAVVWSATRRARAAGAREPERPAKAWWPFIKLARDLDVSPAELCEDDPTYDPSRFAAICEAFGTLFAQEGEPAMGREALHLIVK